VSEVIIPHQEAQVVLEALVLPLEAPLQEVVQNVLIDKKN